MKRLSVIYAFFLALCVSVSAQAQYRSSGGGWSMGLNFGLANPDQDDLDAVIEAGAEADKIGNGLEFGGSFGYNFGSMELLVRPSYYTVSSDSNGHEYEMSAFSIFPMMRWHLLSNQTIIFYTQFGVGYTLMSGTIKEPEAEIEFSGGDMGFTAGLGAEFCFIDSHCFYVEGNIRSLSVDRMTVDKSSGTENNSAISQSGKGDELEINDRDFGAGLSGIQGVIGYNFHF